MNKIYSKIISNIKLFESIGLIMLLTSWVLNEMSVEKYNKVFQSINDSFNSYFQLYSSMQNIANTSHESAITRCYIKNPNLKNLDSVDRVKEIWRSGEVRYYRLRMLFNSYYHAESVMKNYNQIISEYFLKKNSSIINAENLHDSLSSHFVSIMPMERYTSETTFIPSIESFSRDKHEIMYAKSVRFTREMVKSYFYIKNVLYERKDDRALFYYTIFILGTLLTVFSKLLDWYDFKKMNLHLTAYKKIKSIGNKI